MARASGPSAKPQAESMSCALLSTSRHACMQWYFRSLAGWRIRWCFAIWDLQVKSTLSRYIRSRQLTLGCDSSQPLSWRSWGVYCLRTLGFSALEALSFPSWYFWPWWVYTLRSSGCRHLWPVLSQSLRYFDVNRTPDPQSTTRIGLHHWYWLTQNRPPSMPYFQLYTMSFSIL